jgi:hypothetical protein
VGDRLRRNFTLAVGAIDEVVIVEAVNGPLQQQTAEIKDVIESVGADQEGSIVAPASPLSSALLSKTKRPASLFAEERRPCFQTVKP